MMQLQTRGCIFFAEKCNFFEIACIFDFPNLSFMEGIEDKL